MAEVVGMARTRIGRDQVIKATATDVTTRPLRAAFAALGAIIALLALGSSSALAVGSHPFDMTFSTGPNCGPREIANDAAGNVYVMCAKTGSNGLTGSLRKFSPTGVPINFTASQPYIEGNEINEDPGPNSTGFERPPAFGSQSMLAVDRSNGLRSGYIYVATGNSLGTVDVFDPTGKYVTSFKQQPGQQPSGVGVGPDGYVYIYWEGIYTHIGKYNPETYLEVERINDTNGENEALQGNVYTGPCCVRVRADSTGAIWTEWGGSFFDGEYEGGRIGKWEADQWTNKLLAGYGTNPESKTGFESPYMDQKYEIENYPEKCPRPPRPKEGREYMKRCSLEGHTFETDPKTNELYLVSSDREKIIAYSEGNGGDPVHQVAPAFGEGHLEATGQGVSLDNSGNLYSTAEPEKVVKFLPGGTLPKVFTKTTAITDEGHTEVTVRGLVDPAGGGAITSCKVAWGETAKHTKPPVNCTEATPLSASEPTEVSATFTGLPVGKLFHFRFEAGNASGTGLGTDRIFETRAVLSLETKPATNVDENSATLNGQFDADGQPTTYWYEYGPTTSYGQETEAETKSGAPGNILQVPQNLTHLQKGHVYHYRLVAENSLDRTYGPDVKFRTASPPEITGVGARNVQETTADLFASINPVGDATTYQFEYGTTPEYGQSLPVELAEREIGSGNEPVPVEVHLENLPVGATIHFRVVAENSWGTSQSDDTTFNFRPPECPNAHIRALTGSNYLPDCRAYELVTPAYAGAVQILPAEGFGQFASEFGGSGFAQIPINFGYATTPSRFAYLGGVGAVQGQDVSNALLDYYEATRTPTGWVTSVPGLKGSETLHIYGHMCSDTQAYCVDRIGPHFKYNESTKEVYEAPKEESPFLYKADGTRLGRLPTNVETVKEGSNYKGDNSLSGDFSHYIFSTLMKFTPDGQESMPGSVYDNDIGAKTVTVISKDANDNPIEIEPQVVGTDTERITGIAGVSTNGLRVLMAGTTQVPACNEQNGGHNDIEHFPFYCEYELRKPARLYMRENDAVTKEVSRGKQVLFVGMNRNGSKVYFITGEKMLPADTDTSEDLYMWEAEGDKLTLVSQEGTLGNNDECSATWTVKCGVKMITPEHFEAGEYFDRKAHVQGIDDVLAPGNGDIYFYSPEDLVQGEIGGNGQRNLYLYRNGHLQLVTTFEPGTEIERSTISEDGSHAAFLTRAQLSPYNNNGVHELYTYSADTGALRCASCRPDGLLPAADTVHAAEAGPTMSNDGKAFFATSEALVPQDTDGIRDTYEYANGRAQLISSGTGQNDSTGGLELISLFFSNLHTGLESVSRDGTDVYFSSFETLAPEDQNGTFMKIYDARVGGGFDVTPDLGNCAAADECHGAGSSPMPTPEIATGGHLGKSGNVQTPHRKKKKHRRHHRKHHKHHAKRHGGRTNG
jgi:hypothetical protein